MLSFSHFQGVQGGKGEQGPAGPPGFQVSQLKHTEHCLWSDHPAVCHHTTLCRHTQHDFRNEAKKGATGKLLCNPSITHNS